MSKKKTYYNLFSFFLLLGPNWPCWPPRIPWWPWS